MANSLKKIRHLLISICRIVILYISTLIPRNKKILLFGAWWGNKYDDNPRYLFEYVVKKRKDIKSYWITPSKTIYDSLRKKNLPVCYSYSIKAIWLTLRAKNMVVCTARADIGSNLMMFTGGMRQVSLWHGVPLKKIMYDDNFAQSRKLSITDRILNKIEHFPKREYVVFCTSDYYHKIYQSAFRLPASHVLNLGQARNDYFYSEHDNPLRYRFDNKKIILYMPTHRREGKQKMDMSKLLNLYAINEECEKNNAVFLIKKHYYHANESVMAIENFCNILDITREISSSQVLLDACDILITDYSSCFIDHLLLNRPQIFYAYDLEDYLANDREMYCDYIPNAPGRICTSTDELCEEIAKLLSGHDEYTAKRAQQLDHYYSKENQCVVSPKQIDAILSL